MIFSRPPHQQERQPQEARRSDEAPLAGRAAARQRRGSRDGRGSRRGGGKAAAAIQFDLDEIQRNRIMVQELA